MEEKKSFQAVEDLLIVVLSGGGSSLLTAPAPGIALDDIRTITGQLLRCGAAIGEINAIRKHLSRVKGGGLARLAFPARVLGLLLSDVAGDDPSVIASGPTVPDPTTFENCVDILDRYALRETAPSRVRRLLERGRRGLIPETPKPGDPVFGKVRNIIIG
ncbi:MAG: glycerate-2-kinase family protein, partial [PVC group bacterium]